METNDVFLSARDAAHTPPRKLLPLRTVVVHSRNISACVREKENYSCAARRITKKSASKRATTGTFCKRRVWFCWANYFPFSCFFYRHFICIFSQLTQTNELSIPWLNIWRIFGQWERITRFVSVSACQHEKENKHKCSTLVHIIITWSTVTQN